MRGRTRTSAALAALAVLGAAVSVVAGAIEARAARATLDSSVRNLALPAPSRLTPAPSPAGKETRFAKNDVVFAFRLDQPPVARLSRPLSIQAAGKAFLFPPEQDFVLSITDRRMRGRLSPRSRIFCGEASANMTAILIASFLSKYGQETRPCLVDSDGDMRFDHFFLSGTKREEDSALVPIEPAAFAVQERDGGPGDSVDFVFRGFTGSGKLKLGVRRHVAGKSKDFLSLFLGVSISDFQRLSDEIQLRPDSFDKAVPPFQVGFMSGATVRVQSIDADRSAFTGIPTQARQPLWAYFLSGREKYVPHAR